MKITCVLFAQVIFFIYLCCKIKKMNKCELRDKTNFQNDLVEYGLIGEQKLCQLLTEKGKQFIDVSNLKEFREYDIDIIQIQRNNLTNQDFLNILKSGESLKNVDAISYEVKTDTVGLKSRNIIWEVFSNSNIGCMIKTKADYLYYVFIDDNKNVVEEYLINLKKLRWWLMSNFHNINQCNYLKSKSMRRGEDNTGIFLINIDYLLQETNNIAYKI
jgi:hypothetical protein